MSDSANKEVAKASEKANIAKAAAGRNKKDKLPIWKRIGKYFREAKSEFKKIVWPSFKSVTNNTLVVMVVVAIVGVFIWILDLLLRVGLDAILQRV